MDERLRRLWAGSEALVLGKEGVKTVAFATETIRKSGGGRKSLSETNQTLVQDLEQLIALGLAEIHVHRDPGHRKAHQNWLRR